MTFYRYAVADGIHRPLPAARLRGQQPWLTRTGPQSPPPGTDKRQLVFPFAKPPP